MAKSIVDQVRELCNSMTCIIHLFQSKVGKSACGLARIGSRVRYNRPRTSPSATPTTLSGILSRFYGTLYEFALSRPVGIHDTRT